MQLMDEMRGTLKMGVPLSWCDGVAAELVDAIEDDRREWRVWEMKDISRLVARRTTLMQSYACTPHSYN